MPLPDSGARRSFGEGLGVRDIDIAKGRCDLLPLEVIGEWLGYEELVLIERFIRTHDVKYLHKCASTFCENMYNGFDDLSEEQIVLEVSKHYRDGAEKYEERNWEKGIPLHSYIDSGVRHYLKQMNRDSDEPHNRAFLWNIWGAIWTMKNKPELNDLPSVVSEDDESVKGDPVGEI